MSEAELLAQAAATMTGDVTSIVALFSFVFSYLAALFFFIRRTEFIVKFLAFGLFTICYIYIVFAQITAKALWRSYVAAREHAIGEGLLPPYWEPGTASDLVLFAERLAFALFPIAWFALFYLTFVYRWKVKMDGRRRSQAQAVRPQLVKAGPPPGRKAKPQKKTSLKVSQR